MSATCQWCCARTICRCPLKTPPTILNFDGRVRLLCSCGLAGEKALPQSRSTARGAVRGNMADGLGFFGGGGNYSDSSESDSDADDEREAACEVVAEFMRREVARARQS